MTLNLFRCRAGYVLTADHVPDPKTDDPVLGPLDFIGQFSSGRLSEEVRERVLEQVNHRGYAVISKDELGLP